MKFHLLRRKILPANVDLVIFDPLDHKYLIVWLTFQVYIDKYDLKQHLKHLKSTLSIGYPSTLKPYMKFHLLRVNILPANADLVVFDPLDHKYVIVWLIFQVYIHKYDLNCI